MKYQEHLITFLIIIITMIPFSEGVHYRYKFAGR